MLGVLLMRAALIIVIFFGTSFANDDPWFFTADTMAEAHRYQRQFGLRLRNSIEPQQCLYGQKEFLASHQGQRFSVPCKFVSETVRQLRELLESGEAKYLFALDVGYAGLAVPADVYKSKYENLPRNEILPALLREPSLVVIYHTGIHLKPTPSASERPAQKHTVVGFYDGRPNLMVPSPSDDRVYGEPAGLVQLHTFHIAEHFLGELTFVASGRVVTFDMSFDDAAEALPEKSLSMTAIAR